MNGPAELLTEAGANLTRAQALLQRAALELGPPTEEAIGLLAGDLERLRRRIRNASTTATGRMQR